MSSPLDRLAAGTLDWLVRNLPYFDPYSARGRSAEHEKVKAVLELALLGHCWARLDPRDDRLAATTALLSRLWRLPSFGRLLAAQPDWGPLYGLAYAALAPAGAEAEPRRKMLERVLAGGFLSRSGKTAYQRLETRFYADKAGVGHDMEPYEELAGLSPLVRPPKPLTTPGAYALTHAGFYLSDFGRHAPALAGPDLERARDLTGRALDHYVERDHWDLSAELALTQFCLGVDPRATPSGRRAIERLARVQDPDGAIPARSAALRVYAATPGEFFHKAYHTTVVTALMALIVSCG